MNPDTAYGWSRPWYNNVNRALYPCSVVNGGSATALCHTPAGVYTTSFTNGGLITANPAGSAANVAAIAALGGQFATAGSGGFAAANALKGTQFVGPNAQPVPFNYGTARAAIAIAARPISTPTSATRRSCRCRTTM